MMFWTFIILQNMFFWVWYTFTTNWAGSPIELILLFVAVYQSLNGKHTMFLIQLVIGFLFSKALLLFPDSGKEALYVHSHKWQRGRTNVLFLVSGEVTRNERNSIMWIKWIGPNGSVPVCLRKGRGPTGLVKLAQATQ